MKEREEKKQVAQAVSYWNQTRSLKWGAPVGEAAWVFSLVPWMVVYFPGSRFWGGCLSNQDISQALALQKQQQQTVVWAYHINILFYSFKHSKMPFWIRVAEEGM